MYNSETKLGERGDEENLVNPTQSRKGGGNYGKEVWRTKNKVIENNPNILVITVVRINVLNPLVQKHVDLLDFKKRAICCLQQIHVLGFS